MIQDRYVVTSHPVCLKVVKQQTKGERSEECPVGIKRVGKKKHPNFPVYIIFILCSFVEPLILIKLPCRGRCRNNRWCVCLSLVLSSMILSGRGVYSHTFIKRKLVKKADSFADWAKVYSMAGVIKHYTERHSQSVWWSETCYLPHLLLVIQS